MSRHHPANLMWCAEHDEPALAYADGSVQCMYDLIVESNNAHTLVTLPQIEALAAERDALQAKVDAALAAIRDIDAHATPMGLLHADDPEGSPAYYHLTVGALHRALALTGAAAPCADLPCQRAAALQAKVDAAEKALEWAQGAIDRRQAKVDAIDALHQCSQQTYPDEPQWCDDCGCGWPCSTHLALHPEGDTPT